MLESQPSPETTVDIGARAIGAQTAPRTPHVRTLSRRRAVASALGVAAFWGAAGRQRARAAPAVAPPAVGADVDPGSLHTKLVRRVTMGLTLTELNLATSLGYEGYLERHLAYEAIDDSVLDPMLAPLDTLDMTPLQLFALPGGQVTSELTQAAIVRSVFSPRQLYERMVEFWTDHFNIDINNGDDRYLKTVDDRDVIRVHAMTTFPQLLDASAHSPAMLLYLDNNVSIAGNPNENYARELMELHTMGVDGGYTQTDVQEVARCFTGWTLWQRGAGELTGTFRFRLDRHDQGTKTIFAGTPQELFIPANGGINDGLMVLNALCNHPSTAQFISKKLCRWLLSEYVHPATVDAVAAVYTKTGGDIRAMIRAALAPNVLADAAPRYKRPYHLMTSAMRGLTATITTINGIRNNLTSAGHLPFMWGPPDGYPDYLDYWVGLVLPRWNLGAQVGGLSLSGVTVNFDALFAGTSTAQQIADRIDSLLFAGEMPAADKARIVEYLLPNPPSTTRRREAVGLAIGSPGFQWY